MAYLGGKFARFKAGGINVVGSFKWSVSFKRDRLDTTSFESIVGASGYNVHSDGLTGVLDTTFNVDGHASDALVNILFPDASVVCELLFRKTVSLGYVCTADVLDFNANTAVRDKAGFSASLQANGLVSPAA